VPVYKQVNEVSAKNYIYRLLSLLNNLSRVFDLIVYDHLFYYFKNRLNLFNMVFISPNPLLLTWHHTHVIKTPLVCAQRHADAVNFALSNAFDCVPTLLLLRKLSA
jgi:hypothetical protein